MHLTPRRLWRPLAALAMTGALVLAPSAQAAQNGVAQRTLVSSTPVSYTPNMKTGYIVHEQSVIGDTVYVGGQFTQFENAARTVTYDRQNFVSYTASTGAVSPLVLNFNGDVYAMTPNADGSALFIGGAFTTVNGVARGSLVKLNRATGTIDSTFKWPGGFVYALQSSSTSLYVGGTFAKRLMAVSPTTGADTGKVNLTIDGSLGTGSGAIRVAKFAINPVGTDLVAIGNFTTVAGKSRNSAFRLNLTTTPATLTDWHPARFNVVCSSRIPFYLRDVAWAPDGSYFVVASTGGPNGGYPLFGFCDAAGRWNASSSGSTAEPAWINWTGGDSLYTVVLSGVAVYVGGHNRWLDNPLGHDSAGPGAYTVNSIGAINPATGQAIRTWDAMYVTRGHGKEDLTLYPGGMVMGGDGTLVKGRYHNAVSLFKLP